MAYTFISGATGGIGKAFATQCATLGYSLYVTARDEQKLNSLKQFLEKEYNVSVIYFACDLTSLASRREMLLDIDNKGIKFERILNVAGVDTQKGFIDYSENKILFQLRVNAEATVHLTHQLLKRRTQKASLLAVSSMSGANPMPYFALYSATKSMLINLYTALHYELKEKGVKVTVVMPGGVPTRQDIIEDIKGQGVWGKLSSMSAEKVAVKSLKALQKNKVKYIPGAFNRFLYFLMKLVPKGIVLRFIKKRWQKQSKDAFDGEIEQ